MVSALIDVCQHERLAGGGKVYADGLVKLFCERSLSADHARDFQVSVLCTQSQSATFEPYCSEGLVIDTTQRWLHPSSIAQISRRMLYDFGFDRDAQEYAKRSSEFDLVHMTGDRMSPRGRIDTPVVLSVFGGNHWTRARDSVINGWFRSTLVKQTLIQSLKRAAAIVVPSIFLKDVLVGIVGVDKNRIFVNELVWWSRDILSATESMPDALCNVDDLSGVLSQSVLYSSAGYLYKNHKLVFEAISQYNQEKPDSRLHLVLTGRYGDAVSALIQQYRSTVPVISCGYVSRGELRWLMENCAVYAHSSLYEAGGSFSIYEAAQCSCPVVCSGTGSLLELSNAYALNFDPYDARSLKKCLQEVISSEMRRHEMQEMGHTFLQQYTADRALGQLAEAYEYAAGR